MVQPSQGRDVGGGDDAEDGQMVLRDDRDAVSPFIIKQHAEAKYP